MRKEEASEAERKARARFWRISVGGESLATAGPQRRSEREIEGGNLLRGKKGNRSREWYRVTHARPRWEMKSRKQSQGGAVKSDGRGPSPGRSVGAGSG